MECGGQMILNEPRDRIILTSPGYPESPKHDATCEWIIKAPISFGLQVTFQEEKWFEMKPKQFLDQKLILIYLDFYRTSCNINNSYLEIFNGGSVLSSLNKKICIPPFNVNTIRIDSHLALIRYVLKTKDFHSRFNATFSIDNCDRRYIVPFGDADFYKFPELDSFNSLSRTSPINSCTLTLKSQANFRIVLNITSIFLRGKDCDSGEVIEIRDNGQMRKLCPPKNDSNINSTSMEIVADSNELILVYRRINYDQNDLQYRNDSFPPIGIQFYASSKYKSKNTLVYFICHRFGSNFASLLLFRIGCYHFIDVRLNPNGMIFSPNYPKASTTKVSCSWLFYNDPGSRIRLFFNWFDLGGLPLSEHFEKTNKTFPCNRIVLISKNLFASRFLMDKYGCARKRPKIIQSLSNVMAMRLYANQLDVNEGFSLSYVSINDNSRI